MTINYNGNDYLFTEDEKYQIPGTKKIVTVISRGCYTRVSHSIYDVIQSGELYFFQTLEKLIERAVRDNKTIETLLINK